MVFQTVMNVPGYCNGRGVMARIFLFVLDSVGIGGAPDAADFGDLGSNTIGHIAKACLNGEANRDGLRSGQIERSQISKNWGLALQLPMPVVNCPPDLILPRCLPGDLPVQLRFQKGRTHLPVIGKLPGFRWRRTGAIFPRPFPLFQKSLPTPSSSAQAFLESWATNMRRAQPSLPNSEKSTSVRANRSAIPQPTRFSR